MINIFWKNLTRFINSKKHSVRRKIRLLQICIFSLSFSLLIYLSSHLHLSSHLTFSFTSQLSLSPQLSSCLSPQLALYLLRSPLSSQLSFPNSLFSPLLSRSLVMSFFFSLKTMSHLSLGMGLGPCPVWRNVHIMQKVFV